MLSRRAMLFCGGYVNLEQLTGQHAGIVQCAVSSGDLRSRLLLAEHVSRLQSLVSPGARGRLPRISEAGGDGDIIRLTYSDKAALEKAYLEIAKQLDEELACTADPPTAPLLQQHREIWALPDATTAHVRAHELVGEHLDRCRPRTKIFECIPPCPGYAQTLLRDAGLLRVALQIGAMPVSTAGVDWLFRQEHDRDLRSRLINTSAKACRAHLNLAFQGARKARRGGANGSEG